MPEPEFNVFISYNSKDKDIVWAIAERLRDVDELKVWLDEWEIVPGTRYQPALVKGLSSSSTVAVFIGVHGLGDWQVPEMETAMNAQVKRGIRVVPVLLPGVPALPENLPMFLEGQSAVTYRSLADENGHAKLVWGITGKNPLLTRRPGREKEPLQPAAADPLEAGVEAVASALINGDMTFLLGRLLGAAGAAAAALPSMLSMALLRDVNLVPEDYQGLLPDIESAASLLAATRGDPQMESLVLRLVGASSQPEPNAYAELANIMRLLGKRPPAQRARRRAPRLILSTNLDLHMEHALLRAGLPFTRLVHHRAGGRIDICRFANVVKDQSGELRIDGRPVALDNSALDAQINICEPRSVRLQESEPGQGNPLVSLDISATPDPILYKFQGSEDIDNSSAISTDQCYEFLSRVLRQPCVPSQITEIIGNSTLVILGSTLLDREFRLSYHALLREALRSNPYSFYAVLNRKELDKRDFAHKYAEQSWDSVKKAALAKYKVEMFDASVADFLKRVADRLPKEWRGA